MFCRPEWSAGGFLVAGTPDVGSPTWRSTVHRSRPPDGGHLPLAASLRGPLGNAAASNNRARWGERHPLLLALNLSVVRDARTARCRSGWGVRGDYAGRELAHRAHHLVTALTVPLLVRASATRRLPRRSRRVRRGRRGARDRIRAGRRPGSSYRSARLRGVSPQMTSLCRGQMLSCSILVAREQREDVPLEAHSLWQAPWITMLKGGGEHEAQSTFAGARGSVRACSCARGNGSCADGNGWEPAVYALLHQSRQSQHGVLQERRHAVLPYAPE